MPAILTRADSLREYLSGATSDGGSQSNPSNSLGNYRSSTEAASLGIAITNPISGVIIGYAGGANPAGDGTLTAINSTQLTWQPANAAMPGSPATFSGTSNPGIVEGPVQGQYLRVTVTTPMTPSSSIITLSNLYNNAFGFENVLPADATAGIIEYRATMVRNESAGTVSSFKRWISTLGTFRISNSAWLSASGAGTISTSGSLADWPDAGWCHIKNSGGTTKEVVYYASRTNSTLTITGRALLGTSATAGSTSDLIYPVPGVAIAIDTAGVQNFGTSIQTIANKTTAPTGLTWNIGITEATGLNIGTLTTSKQVGIWMKRHCPAGLIAAPSSLVKLSSSFAGP